MFKKIILASAILAASSSVAFAAAGPYVGASVGVNTGTFQSHDTPSDITLGGRGAIGNLFAGYGAMVNQTIYLGGEVFGDLTNTNASVTLGGFTGRIKNKYGYGISFIPGVMLSDHTMAYARLGVVRSHFETTATDMNGTARSALNGGQVGVGLQTSLTQNIDLRGEYDFTKYRSNRNVGTPRMDAFTVGLAYKFD